MSRQWVATANVQWSTFSFFKFYHHGSGSRAARCAAWQYNEHVIVNCGWCTCAHRFKFLNKSSQPAGVLNVPLALFESVPNGRGIEQLPRLKYFRSLIEGKLGRLFWLDFTSDFYRKKRCLTVTRPGSLNYNPSSPVRVSECWLHDVVIMTVACCNRYSRTVSASETNIYYGSFSAASITSVSCTFVSMPGLYCNTTPCILSMPFSFMHCRYDIQSVSYGDWFRYAIIFYECHVYHVLLDVLWCRNMYIKRILHCKVSLCTWIMCCIWCYPSISSS